MSTDNPVAAYVEYLVHRQMVVIRRLYMHISTGTPSTRSEHHYTTPSHIANKSGASGPGRMRRTPCSLPAPWSHDNRNCISHPQRQRQLPRVASRQLPRIGTRRYPLLSWRLGHLPQAPRLCRFSRHLLGAPRIMHHHIRPMARYL